MPGASRRAGAAPRSVPWARITRISKPGASIRRSGHRMSGFTPLGVPSSDVGSRRPQVAARYSRAARWVDVRRLASGGRRLEGSRAVHAVAQAAARPSSKTCPRSPPHAGRAVRIAEGVVLLADDGIGAARARPAGAAVELLRHRDRPARQFRGGAPSSGWWRHARCRFAGVRRTAADVAPFSLGVGDFERLHFRGAGIAGSGSCRRGDECRRQRKGVFISDAPADRQRRSYQAPKPRSLRGRLAHADCCARRRRQLATMMIGPAMSGEPSATRWRHLVIVDPDFDK